MANVLITGTSSGIGLATALELARAGHRVFATMRNPAAVPELREMIDRERLPIEIRTLDVESDQSVRECFESVTYVERGWIPRYLRGAADRSGDRGKAARTADHRGGIWRR